MAEESFQERTEQATPKRVIEAREKGQVARSRELSTMAVLMGSAIGLLLVGEYIADGLKRIMSSNFSVSRSDIFDMKTGPEFLLHGIENALQVITPFLFIVFTIAILSPLVIGGWNFSVEAMMFKWEKLDPIRGIKRIVSVRSLVELIKALFKFAIVLFVSILLIWLNIDKMLFLSKLDALTSISKLSLILIWAFMIISSAMIVIALIDVPFQIWDHSRNLKMTRQEVKEEHKQTDGSPELKRHLRERQRELTRRRMMSDVPKADVIVTNPTHYAVALKYDHEKMAAPRVVAKGKDLVAFQIRNIAQTSNIPILSAPPLSRALYFSTKVGQQIPDGLFLAVAQVLAYVFQLKRSNKNHKQEYQMKNELPIPEEYARD